MMASKLDISDIGHIKKGQQVSLNSTAVPSLTFQIQLRDWPEPVLYFVVVLVIDDSGEVFDIGD
jgi:hypothetical protein